MSDEQSSEECVIGDDDDFDLDSDELQIDCHINHASMKISQIISICNAYLYDIPISRIDNSKFYFNLPKSFLPLSMQAVYGFTVSNILLEVEIELDQYSWTSKPNYINIKHPVYGQNYIGRALVKLAVDNFFKPFFKPRSSYRSTAYLLSSGMNADLTKLRELIDAGFNEKAAENALIIYGNNKNAALNFLRTGDINFVPPPCDISFKECPLIYLILELSEVFFDLPDHCCICRSPLSYSSIKPSVCDKEFCQFRFTEIGIGTSVYFEIKRDPLVADLIISLFAASINDNYCDPKPSNFCPASAILLFSQLPSMFEIVHRCSNDSELIDFIGRESYELIKWIILSNRSQLFAIPKEFRMNGFGDAYQFLSLMSTPQSEKEFEIRCAKYGKINLFHGSSASRWHSILRNGLKNATGTKMMANGAALGSGIYFAAESSTSNGYSRITPNPYKNSKFGENLFVIALCDVANVPELKNHGWAHTLTDEKAVIVRFLFVGSQFHRNVLNDPPKGFPSLRDILELHADQVY